MDGWMDDWKEQQEHPSVIFSSWSEPTPPWTHTFLFITSLVPSFLSFFIQCKCRRTPNSIQFTLKFLPPFTPSPVSCRWFNGVASAAALYCYHPNCCPNWTPSRRRSVLPDFPDVHIALQSLHPLPLASGICERREREEDMFGLNCMFSRKKGELVCLFACCQNFFPLYQPASSYEPVGNDKQWDRRQHVPLAC